MVHILARLFFILRFGQPGHIRDCLTIQIRWQKNTISGCSQEENLPSHTKILKSTKSQVCRVPPQIEVQTISSFLYEDRFVDISRMMPEHDRRRANYRYYCDGNHRDPSPWSTTRWKLRPDPVTHPSDYILQRARPQDDQEWYDADNEM